MQQILNVRKTLLCTALALGASNAALAASESFDVTVTALPDLVLTEESALSYGTNVYVDAGGVCTMDGDVPGDVLAQLNGTATAAQGGTYGDISGTGCVTNGAGTSVGLYKIAGLQGQTVNISIGGVSGTDFSFAPAGCIGTYDGATTTDGDTCATYTGAQTAVAKPLAATNDDDANVTAGELLFTVGGSITIGGVNLTANQAYAESFPVDVVY